MSGSQFLAGCCVVALSLCVASASWAQDSQDSLSKKVEKRVSEAVSEVQEEAHNLAGQIRTDSKGPVPPWTG